MPPNRRRNDRRTAPASQSVLDQTDESLLTAILREPRQSLTDLGKAAGISRPAAAERLARLVREGVIAAWRVELNPEALGLRYTVFARVRPNGGQSDAVENVIRSIPEVVECYRTTGEDNLLLKMHVATVPGFEQIVSRLRRYGQVTAVDVLSTVVSPRPPPLPSPSDPHAVGEAD